MDTPLGTNFYRSATVAVPLGVGKRGEDRAWYASSKSADRGTRIAVMSWDAEAALIGGCLPQNAEAEGSRGRRTR